MIDLDQAQRDAAEANEWDAHLRLNGRVVVLRHPTRVEDRDSRKGLLPAAWAVIVRVWRLVFGGSEIAALRRDVLGAVDENDAGGLAAVKGFGLWELTLILTTYQAATKRYRTGVAMAALLKSAAQAKVEAPSNGLSTGVHTVFDARTGRKAQSVELRPGGGPLPGLIFGGSLWGKAAVDAEAAAKAKDTSNTNSGGNNG